MSTITLFYAPRTRASTALWLLEELGVEYALESFAMNSGRHRRPDYLAMNALGKVPLVLHGGVPVSERSRSTSRRMPSRTPAWHRASETRTAPRGCVGSSSPAG